MPVTKDAPKVTVATIVLIRMVSLDHIACKILLHKQKAAPYLPLECGPSILLLGNSFTRQKAIEPYLYNNMRNTLASPSYCPRLMLAFGFLPASQTICADLQHLERK